MQTVSNNTNAAPAQNAAPSFFSKIGKGTWAIIAVVAILVIWGIGAYNDLVTQDENVKNAWGNVQADYQRRADLIPNLVSTVKGYAKHEEKVFTEVTEARAKVGSININADSLTDEQIQQYQKAQSEMSGALSKLIAVSENYPELKANENFRDLQAQLEGTENRIKKSRTDYNAVVKEYNLAVRRFPKSIFAGIFGFSVKSEFQADEGAEKATKVSFD